MEPYSDMNAYSPSEDFIIKLSEILPRRETKILTGKACEILPLLSQVSRDNPWVNWPKNIYRSQTQINIFDRLLRFVDSLSMDRFDASNGSSTCILVGPKGIGKSGCLRRFVDVCSSLYPNVIAGYITYEDVKKSDICELSLTCYMRNFLAVHDIPLVDVIEGSGDSMIKRIARTLKSRGKYLFLVLDEVDKLYTMSPSEKYLDHLNDLIGLGNQSSGRIFTLVSGSSTRLRGLFAKTLTNVSKEFKLYDEAPTFNLKKFHDERVYAAIPTDIATVAVLLDIEVNESNIEDLRATTFFTGCNARSLDIYRSTGSSDANRDLISPGTFLRALMDSLVGLNATLLQGLTKDNIGEVAWETKLEPVELRLVENLWNRQCVETKMHAKANMNGELERLSDTGDIIVTSTPRRVYPSSMYRLLEHYNNHTLEPRSFQLYWKRFLELVSPDNLPGSLKQGYDLVKPFLKGKL
jgi:hypothetical protein